VKSLGLKERGYKHVERGKQEDPSKKLASGHEHCALKVFHL